MALRRLQKHWKWTRHWLILSSHVSESPCLLAGLFVTCLFFLLCQFCKHFPPSVVQLDNAIGDAGARHLADMLKVNTTLTHLNLSGELCFWFALCHLEFQFIHVPDILNDCVCCIIETLIGDDGVGAIVEALKVNSKLVDINLEGEWNTGMCFSLTSHPIREQEL